MAAFRNTCVVVVCCGLSVTVGIVVDNDDGGGRKVEGIDDVVSMTCCFVDRILAKNRTYYLKCNFPNQVCLNVCLS